MRSATPTWVCYSGMSLVNFHPNDDPIVISELDKQAVRIIYGVSAA